MTDHGDSTSLVPAIREVRLALRRGHAQEPELQSQLLQQLGQNLTTLYEIGISENGEQGRLAGEASLAEAVRVLRSALTVTQSAGFPTSNVLNSLARALLYDYMQSADPSALPEMLEVQRAAAAAADHELVPKINLAGVLRLHWEVFSRPEHLDEAIEILGATIDRHSATAVPTSGRLTSTHTDLTWAMGMLGLLKRDQYLRDGHRSLIDESIQLYRTAMSTASLGPMHRQVLTAYLAAALLQRGGMQDLEEAIDLQQATLDSAYQIGGQANIWRVNLAAMLRRRDLHGDLDSAIDLYRQVLSQTGARLLFTRCSCNKFGLRSQSAICKKRQP